jgi:hypothetical protein
MSCIYSYCFSYIYVSVELHLKCYVYAVMFLNCVCSESFSTFVWGVGMGGGVKNEYQVKMCGCSSSA